MVDRENRTIREIELTKIAARITTAHLAEFERLVRTCITCDWFNEEKETCQLANNQKPPARVIAFGCEKYEEEIPF